MKIDEILIPTNNIITPLTEELASSVKNFRGDLFDYLGSIRFLQNLISPDRLKAKDLERDKKGRIKVNITNPHILENMDFFRKRAIFFQENGRYTDIYPNPAPGSEYKNFWDEEIRRCIEGYTREEDGEWIPGYYYFYLNYFPIMRTINLEDKRADRVYDFPDIWDSDYLFFHYVEQGEASSEYGAVIKSRGKGYSFKLASMMARNFYLIKKSKSFALASETEYLLKDGIMNKCWDGFEFLDTNTPWAKSRHVKNTVEHKKASYIDADGQEKGYRSEVMAVTTKGNPEKAHPYSQTVYTPNGKTTWENVKVGTNLFHPNGGVTTVTEVHEFGEGDVYKITFSDGRVVYSSLDHEWEYTRFGYSGMDGKKEKKEEVVYRGTTAQLIELLKAKSTKTNRLKFDIGQPGEFEERDVPIDPYTLGLMLGDGSIGKSNDNRSPITMMHSDFDSISSHIPYKTKKFYWGKSPIRCEIFIPNGRTFYKQLDLFDKKSGTKFIPDIYKYNSIEVRLGVISGLLDADGSVTKDYGVIEYCSKSEQMANDFIEIVRSLGIGAKRGSRIINGTTYYRCYVYCAPEEERLFKLERKREIIKVKKNNVYAESVRRHIKIKSIEFSHRERLKCVTVADEDSKYYIGEFVPTLNSRGKRAKILIHEEAGIYPNLLQTWNIARPSLEDGDYTFGYQIAFGTGGTVGAKFEGLEELFYRGKGYKIMMLENVFDKGNINSECAFFVPEYMNRKGCYDQDGNSDVIAALVQLLKQRKIVRDNVTKSNIYSQERSERPVTPQEAVLRIEGNLFPIQDLKDYLAEISVNLHKFTASHYTGRLKISSDGAVDFVYSDSKTPIRDFPIKDNVDKAGAIEIFEHPVRLASGTVPRLRYLGGIDPYDDDHSTTNSLGSIFILDRFTDRIVAEYTGRPETANEFYEICLRLAKYYNAIICYENDKKGIYQYLYNKNALHYLADNPEILSEKDLVKIQNNYGNKKKGVNSSKAINAWGRRLQADWLISNAYGSGGEDDDGNEIAPIMNLQQLRSVGYIKELIAWHPDINADRVSAMGMLMILREDYLRLDKAGTRETRSEILDDPFFKRTGNSLPMYSYTSFN